MTENAHLEDGDLKAQFAEARRLLDRGEAARALSVAKELIQNHPDSVQAHFLAGIAARQDGDVEHAIVFLKRAARLAPQEAELWFHLANAERHGGDLEAAIASYGKARSIAPGVASVAINLAGLLVLQGQAYEALKIAQEAAELAPESCAAWGNLAAALLQTGNASRAKETALKALSLEPRDLNARGTLAAALKLLGRSGEALEQYEFILSTDPDNREALLGLCELKRKAGNLEAAITLLTAAVQRNTNDVALISQLAAFSQETCSWDLFETWALRLDALPISGGQVPAEHPLFSISRSMDLARNQAVAEAWSRQVVLRAGPPLTSASTRRGERGRLHIGYLSGDFHDHPVAHDVVGLFKLHDRDRFQVTAFSFGPDDASANRKAIMEACDDFFEIRNLDTRAAATFIQNKNVDILVDLKGFTLPHRMEISALRPAPVQVSYLGFPGTSGADFFDYILTDRTVTPLEAEKFYSEKFVHLPVSYHITDDRQKVAACALSRIDEGLPPDAFVLAGFNRPFKIDREMFATWMRLLKILPDAVLWLLATDPLTAANLRAAAASHGIKPERIIFAKRRKKAEHLERLALADLALDTRIYNGHTTTIDALWVGLPVITILGDHFASRASASLLEALGMPELITRSLKEYQMLIADLARDRGRLAGLRGALRERCKTQPLFNTEKSVRNIERAYLDIWQRYSDGNEPISFDLSQAKIQ